MIRNYLKIAFRNLAKQKLFSMINIAGLAIGISGSLLILVYVFDQLSYESFHTNRDRIYRVSVTFGTSDAAMTIAGAMPALGPAAAADIPEVESAVRLRVDHQAKIKAAEKEFTESRFFFADSNVFDMFTFPLIAGNKTSPLSDPSSIVISEKIARKYFGDGNPIGKTLVYNDKYDFVVSAVMKNVPRNTLLRCELIAPYSGAMQIQKPELPWMHWGEDYTYLLLARSATPDHLRENLRQLILKNTNEHFAAMIDLVVLPLSDIYFKSDMMGELGQTGNLSSVYLFSSIAILVLFIACLNFINLSTARSLRRAKEVGLRKVLGAQRTSLVSQFFGESFIITLIAVILSLFIYELVNPILNSYFSVHLDIAPYQNYKFYIILLGIVLFVSLLAGVYPAIFLSRFKPVNSLRGTKMPGTSGVALRKALIVLQFAISIFLITGTAAIYRQLDFMRNSDLGFDKNDVITVDFPAGNEELVNKYPVVKAAFSSIPGVKDVSGAYTLPGINNKETQSVKVEGKPEEESSILQAIGIDYNFIPTLGLTLLQGRNFSEQFGTDRDNAIILNETAVKRLGLRNPIGTEVELPSGEVGKPRLARIIGIIKDFHVTSFHKEIEPLFLYINPRRYYTIALRINSEEAKGIIPALKTEWERILPDSEFNYSTLARQYNGLYESDEKTGTLFSIFASLSILIACMGLFGLVSYTIEIRKKEIGIRKVLGANLANITTLLSKDFTRWVFIANLFALPVAWYAINKWLQNFAYRIEIGWWVFLLAGGLALTIALLTVSTQAIRAALANPVESLRHE